ncbi:MAG TPA: hypothetical protein DEG44_04795 [Candidatus Kerfeldbacteria bacterium]|nr:hypothetical protein [Candidatus Kerfeldbacteria bacterium]
MDLRTTEGLAQLRMAMSMSGYDENDLKVAPGTLPDKILTVAEIITRALTYAAEVERRLGIREERDEINTFVTDNIRDRLKDVLTVAALARERLLEFLEHGEVAAVEGDDMWGDTAMERGIREAGDHPHMPVDRLMARNERRRR